MRLRGSIKLALEVLEYKIPVFALNLMDVSERKGFKINIKLLEQELGSPVIPTVAVKNQGLDEITETFEQLLKTKKNTKIDLVCSGCSGCSGCAGCGIAGSNGLDYWERARQIVRKTVSRTDAKLILGSFR